MKILYVKNNSERAKEFQLKTIIFEENGVKYVKKQILCPEALVHLKKMKDSYERLTNAIINPNIKLAKIVDESEDSLTFEFIDGVSLETKFNIAEKLGKVSSNKIIEEYKSLLNNSFKTITFDSSTMVTDEFKKLFGGRDYSQLDGKESFEGISNIDLIFSNIIFSGQDVYLIDYEWIFDCNIPLEYVSFRALHLHNELHWAMEKHLIDSYIVNQNGFLNIQDKYFQERLDVSGELQSKDDQIENQGFIIEDKDMIINDKDVHIQSQTLKIEQLSELAESMRIKNRIKDAAKKSMPAPLWAMLQKIKHKLSSTGDAEYISNYLFREDVFNKDAEDNLSSFKNMPLISIIMPVYNVEPKWLELAIASIENQWYTNWELCIADDKSTNNATIEYLKSLSNEKIKITYLEANQNISAASNAALELTTGEYIVLMDNDDEITPNALYEMVKAVNETGAEFIYSDEDKIEMDGTFSDPHFKPDFAPDMFLSQNYLSHLGMIKKELVTKVGGFTLGLEGSQDFDLYLKVLEHTDKIHHISKVLYHWRKIPGSTAAEYGDKSYAQEAGRTALENAMQRRDIKALVKNGQTPGTYKIEYEIIGSPLVSIVIPFKDKPELLTTCIESILEKSRYRNFEIIGISNNSEESQTHEEMKRLRNLDNRIAFYEYNVPFNYSDINNYAVGSYAKGEHILFLNNDIEIITPFWIEELLMYSQQKQTGAVGAKLYFPNDTMQHAGIVLAPKTIHSAILMYQGFAKEYSGYGARLQCVNNYSAVTAACLMMKRELFDRIGGFDEERLSIAYNDVDLCLRAQEEGFRNVWTPYCEAYHHESVSRGYEVSVDSVERREKEKWNLKDKHQEFFSKADPCYNKHLTRFGVGSQLDELVTEDYKLTEGVDFFEKIILSKEIHHKKHSKVCVFSHFDAQNEIKDYVIEYISALSEFMDVIFVSTAEDLTEESIQKADAYCKSIIVKKNVGYDFGAWKTGIDAMGSSLDEYEQLILCNDSVYGPLFDLEDIFETMKSNDFWAMTDNYEIEYHLQSYFMTYTKKAFTHNVFKSFWKDLKIYPNKQILIETNEIGFSKSLMDTELSYAAYYSCKDKNYVNVLHYYWEELIVQHKFPFIKNELIKRNPLNLGIENWSAVISENCDYSTQLITDTLCDKS
jgi:GT2 family glycosyltransferase